MQKEVGNRVKEFTDGEVIFQECDIADKMYLIRSGKVRITKKFVREDQEIDTELAILKPNDFFGEMALFDCDTRSAAATAIGKVVVEEIGPDDLKDHVAKDPHFALLMLRKMSERIRYVDSKIEKLSLKATLSGQQIRENIPWTYF